MAPVPPAAHAQNDDTLSNNNNNNNNNNKRPRDNSSSGRRSGLDTFLQTAAGPLPVGGKLRFVLRQGPPRLEQSADPVDPQAPHESFPALLKFPPQAVVAPNFTQPPWSNGTRLYQQDIPKPLEDSEDEEDANGKPKEKKKRWRYNNAAPKRQWILQEQVDFLETMVNRRSGAGRSNNSDSNNNDNNNNNNKLSSRYEGIPEHNPSQFVLFQLHMPQPASSNHASSSLLLDDDEDVSEQSTFSAPYISVRPVASSTMAFQQPAARATVRSLSQAAQVLEDQRAAASGIRVGHSLLAGKSNTQSSSAAPAAKRRLLQKLLKTGPNDTTAAATTEEADDVMGDVAYRSRKGGGGGRSGGHAAAARRELLLSLGDGVTVSDDGVLGGTNDAAFGGKGQRFGILQADPSATTGENGGGGAAEETTERGADGAAMADDFYTRDVQAEYEALDYDAAEQFDDDDVDLGEGELATDGTGFGDDGEGDEDDEDVDEDAEEEEIVTGAAGLASRAVFKAMLAKARGEIVPDAAEVAAAAAAAAQQRNRSNSPRSPDEEPSDHMAKIMAAADLAAHRKPANIGAAAPAAATPVVAAATVDENGLRIITQEAVQREIWLNHGSIPVKRLSKIFDIGKKYGKERQEKLMAIVKELCTLQNDPVNGKMLVLKQHYSHMT